MTVACNEKVAAASTEMYLRRHGTQVSRTRAHRVRAKEYSVRAPSKEKKYNYLVT
jgi:hypothetical protein